MPESWKDKRKKLFNLVKKISDKYGGDEPEFLNDYVGDIVFEYSENLDVPIRCFQSMIW